MHIPTEAAWWLTASGGGVSSPRSCCSGTRQHQYKRGQIHGRSYQLETLGSLVRPNQDKFDKIVEEG